MKINVRLPRSVAPEVSSVVRNRSSPGGKELSDVLNRIPFSAPSGRNFYLRKAGEEAEGRSVERIPDELKRLLEELQKRFDLFNTQLRIEIDRELDIPVVKIINKETNEVVRQIPPEYLLKIMKNIDQMLGLLVNERI